MSRSTGGGPSGGGKGKMILPRKRSQSSTSVSKQGSQPEVGEKASDFIAAASKTNNAKARAAQFDQVVQLSRITFDSVIANRERSRAMIPIQEKKRVKLPVKKQEKDVEFIQATYASFNREDYIITQSPTKDTVGEFWRMVWQDGCKLIICMIETSGFGDDAEKCFQYFPTSESTPLTCLDGRYTIKLSKKWENKGFATYDLTLSSTDEPEVKEIKDKEESKSKASPKTAEPTQEEENKPRAITLMHYYEWKETEWPDIERLAPFVHTVSNKEVHIIKKITDDYVPPVILQGNLGLNRSCAIWVLLILMKQIERRDCFDVENLAKQLIRMRPGALTNELVFFVMFATAFRIAALGGWSTPEEAKDRVKELKSSAKSYVKF